MREKKEFAGRHDTPAVGLRGQRHGGTTWPAVEVGINDVLLVASRKSSSLHVLSDLYQ